MSVELMTRVRTVHGALKLTDVVPPEQLVSSVGRRVEVLEGGEAVRRQDAVALFRESVRASLLEPSREYGMDRYTFAFFSCRSSWRYFRSEARILGSWLWGATQRYFRSHCVQRRKPHHDARVNGEDGYLLHQDEGSDQLDQLLFGERGVVLIHLLTLLLDPFTPHAADG
ncbi:hypothetical protein EYF80_042083 [Liparis tanakae]|uniref:Uncharacterized protein n=1 Tax=Liparis tanakae TaxID=230148 RepID=A0A4Z2G2B8_9TELE|nr:hypothetical protein EYF80_042083 [Liparis tanakae]